MRENYHRWFEPLFERYSVLYILVFSERVTGRVGCQS